MTIRSVNVNRNIGARRRGATGADVNTSTPSDQITVYDQPHVYAAEDLVPQIVNRTRNAIGVDRVPIYYYQRKKWGNICTCWLNTERIPKQDCHVCFGTGRSGGFQKFGTETMLIDASFPRLVMINVLITDKERPFRIELVDGKSEGFIEAPFSIMPNIGIVDSVTVFPKINYQNYEIRITGESGSYLLTDSNWEKILTEKEVKVRITLKRLNVGDPSPYIESVFIRYRVTNTEINADWPRATKSVSMEDLGLPDVPQQETIVLDDRIQAVSVEDFLYNTRDREAWKIIEAQWNKPLNIVTGWDLQARKVQSFEIFSQFPI